MFGSNSLVDGLSGGTSAAEWDHQQNVVYGYKDGMGLVMDVFTPKNSQNGNAVSVCNTARLHGNSRR